jgi:predicted permease
MYLPFGITPRFAPDEKDLLGHRERLNVSAYGRVLPGHTALQAQAELDTIARNLHREYPDTNRGRGALVMSELDGRMRVDPGDGVQTAILLAIAGLVLLIACANVASLLLSRARARSREIAIRLAIGASRGRLMRQLLTESMVLSVAGGIAGLGLAMLGIEFVSSIRLPTALPVWLIAHLDLRVLAFCAIASLLSGVVFGIAPAIHTLRTDLSGTLKAGDSALSGKRRRFQVRNVLVVGQVAISMLLLLTAALMVKDFATVTGPKAGFRTDHVLLLTLEPSLVGYNETRGRALYREIEQRVSGLPGVRAVALGEHVPLGITSSVKNVVVQGYEMARGQQSVSVLVNSVDEHYFNVMQIPVVSGRKFEPSDTLASVPVAIVNEAMAQTYWPKRSPIGGRIQVGKQTLEVVGVAKTIKYRDLTEQPQPFLYLPFSQQYESLMTLHVETAVDPVTMAAPILAEIRKLDAGTPVQDVQTMQHFFQEEALFGNRLVTQVVSVIGLIGLLLAITGLYGVIAYSVSRRTREIGIRMAIGADPGSVARMVLRQGLLLTSIGAAIGLALSLIASQVLGSLLVGVSARDTGVYIAVPLVLAAISMLACYIPARRAARIDPLLALRQE